MTKTILQTREQSSMAACWDEHLCVEPTSDGHFILSQCRYDILGSIYELIPEDDLFDDQGEMIVPAFIDGQKVVGLEDGEYVQIDSLLDEASSDAFDATSLETAMAFIRSIGWTAEQLGDAWDRLLTIVSAAPKAPQPWATKR